MRRLLSLLLFVAIASASALDAPPAKPDTPILDAALKSAADRRAPVLVDFHAPWCYSCYYMARHVLVGPKWEAIERRTVVVELDADSPEGAYWKQSWGVKALPSYVVLKPDAAGAPPGTPPGSPAELGRILAEQKPDAFYAQIGEILKRSATLEDLQAAAARGGASGLAATREALQTYHARYDASGLVWYDGLPDAQRKTYDADQDVASMLARLRLLEASQKKDAAVCQALAPKVLAADLGCERPYEIDRWASCAASLPEADRKAVLSTQVAPLQKLVDTQVFAKATPKNRGCADARSAVLGLAEVYEGVGRKADGDAVIRRAVAQTARRAQGRLADDRNAADNWRVYLETLRDDAGLDALYPQLIKAYPDDYVYAFRYGRNLLARGDAAHALPYLEQAAAQAYGQNRLKVAEQRVLALKALNRADDARQVVAEALQANGPWFPEDAAKLKAAL